MDNITKIVKFGLGYRIVDIDCWDFQSTLLQHTIKMMNTSRGFLRNPLNPIKELWELLMNESSKITAYKSVSIHLG